MWYDIFARFYDLAIGWLYRPHRADLIAAAAIEPGMRVLDLACGTGQNFEHIMAALGDEGELIGVDLSPGMLGKAQRRIDRNGWTDRAQLVCHDAATLTPELVGGPVDVVICALGLSVIPEYEDAFRGTWEQLREGGRYAIMDVHATRWVPATSMVRLIARADVYRTMWAPLEQISVDFERSWLSRLDHIHGGRLLLAVGNKKA